ncbi:basic proline-rich protein-like [Myotis daubentonii]|uniref:basic proline-rich protein-like n=1 Tax=Myotis daubentonii TaxID=98922 RepID=UPI0028739EAC|nr:basic proline-rich protein-like [Myotis daubentonii]
MRQQGRPRPRSSRAPHRRGTRPAGRGEEGRGRDRAPLTAGRRLSRRQSPPPAPPQPQQQQPPPPPASPLVGAGRRGAGRGERDAPPAPDAGRLLPRAPRPRPPRARAPRPPPLCLHPPRPTAPGREEGAKDPEGPAPALLGMSVPRRAPRPIQPGPQPVPWRLGFPLPLPLPRLPDPPPPPARNPLKASRRRCLQSWTGKEGGGKMKSEPQSVKEWERK